MINKIYFVLGCIGITASLMVIQSAIKYFPNDPYYLVTIFSIVFLYAPLYNFIPILWRNLPEDD